LILFLTARVRYIKSGATAVPFASNAERMKFLLKSGKMDKKESIAAGKIRTDWGFIRTLRRRNLNPAAIFNRRRAQKRLKAASAVKLKSGNKNCGEAVRERIFQTTSKSFRINQLFEIFIELQ
jgi:hypothetical protein